MLNAILDYHTRTESIDYLKTLQSVANGRSVISISSSTKTALKTFVEMSYEAQKMVLAQSLQ